VAIDEGHDNFHTASERYKPFADLLKADGYSVQPATGKLDKGVPSSIKVLVIANAGSPQAGAVSKPAFTEQECDAIRDWVRNGGSLLLIADHAPFGLAVENLANRFGVSVGKGWVFDRPHGEATITTQLVFSRENGLLGTHPLLRGRDGPEEVKQIRSFTGQSLGVPEGATVLMRLSAAAREATSQTALNAAAEEAAKGNEAGVSNHSVSVACRAQGIALPFGKGKLVVLGEAAMLSAQIIRLNVDGNERVIKVGMNVAGYDNMQFALNLLHWLSGLLD
jgi:hypothetical protein